jgi:hypothetical protein
LPEIASSLDKVLGGKHITGQPDKVKSDKLEGTHALAASAADALLMQLGGDIEVGWGEVSAAGVYRNTRIHVYDWTVTRRALKTEQAWPSKLLAAVLVALRQTGDGNTTTTFVGHDTDMNGVSTLLDIGWLESTPV